MILETKIIVEEDHRPLSILVVISRGAERKVLIEALEDDVLAVLVADDVSLSALLVRRVR